ncbi:MAG: hypothetical protein KAR20_28435 [Candidatus Heimdallarchaeota archaeon]|nr:hypothetical protein [Candidatus Heimdallarchaeota archaeon]
MDYEHMKDTANFMFAALMDAFVDMGISTDLVFTKVAHSFEGECRELLAHDGLDLDKIEDATDMKDLVEHWRDAILELGGAKIANIVAIKDDEIDIEMGECVFKEACEINKQHHAGDIPVCPWIAILYAVVEEKFGKHLHINEADHKVEGDHHFFNLHISDH